MTVLLLDERWPTMIPMEAIGKLYGPAHFGAEVPVAVRWNFSDYLCGEDATGRGVFVSTRAHDAEVEERISAGETVYEAPSRRDPVFTAQQVMRDACRIGEWEQSQTHASLVPFLREETEEFIEAVEQSAGDEALCQELGDVFLQVLFHAEIAERRGAFALDDVALSFITKLRSRAPYLFDGTEEVVPIDRQELLWARGKEEENHREG